MLMIKFLWQRTCRSSICVLARSEKIETEEEKGKKRANENPGLPQKEGRAAMGGKDR